MPNNATFTIGRVLISHMCIKPASSGDSALRPSYELCVFLNGQVFYRTSAAYDSQECRVSCRLALVIVCVLQRLAHWFILCFAHSDDAGFPRF